MIKNKTTHQIISKTEFPAKNIFSQARGLMFRKPQNLIMFFNKEKKISLHNLFVFYPLTLFLLDQNKKVIEIKTNFKPFTFWTSQTKARYLIELGIPTQNKTRLGDQLSF